MGNPSRAKLDRRDKVSLKGPSHEMPKSWNLPYSYQVVKSWLLLAESHFELAKGVRSRTQGQFYEMLLIHHVTSLLDIQIMFRQF